MPRSGEDARRRLQQAALELFGERGYEATTTAEIAARAGVTERTFFRHFADKREALFDGEDAFRAVLSDGVLAAPQDLSPIGALLWAFRLVEPMLEENRSFSGPRAALIAQTPALQERMRTKTAGLVDALSAALRRRGLEEGAATLAAQVGMAAFSHAAGAWFADPKLGLDAHLTRAFDALHDLSSTGRAPRRG
jgi:AcrR family transcriptional regulator